MNTKDHALDLALEALEEPGLLWRSKKAINAIKQARSAPYVASPRVQDTEAHYKGVIEGVQKLFDDKRAQPAPVQQKPLFADIIAQHPGLAEELKAMDEGFELGYQAGLAAAQSALKPLTDEQAQDIVERESWGPEALTLNYQLLRTIRRTEAAHGITEKGQP
jgi:hypothetical protein